MGKKTIFWILFVLFSVVSLLFALAYFSEAFPLVSLDLKMDRSAAFKFARVLAEENGWGPEGFRQAASFGVDGTVQNYVELEAGGAEAFREMIRGELYSPYTWEVRHFRENETNETAVYFTPEGDPYGFVERLPEDQPGAALERLTARELAERTARESWGITLGDYQLIEESGEVRPGGRVDHAFVYERKVKGPGSSTYRLRLGVSGDRLTELSRFMKVPEEFIRSYEEMRSANDTIALGSNIAFALLYILGGCIVGLFFLLRQRWVIWKTPLMWGCLIGLLQFLAGINYFPIMWMHYDTALSPASFILQQVGGVFASSTLMALLMVLSFMAAESLTRKAFPEHLQLWRIWSPEVASTSRVAGFTISGYLLIAVFFAYEVLLYLVNSRWLGWWSPSDALLDPDLLATYFPWLTSIANSAQAGFWEECLFRAVPLASAALLGRRFGRRGWWIAGALVLQAFIFGAGHANYPAQPAYARMVELIIPAIGFGLIYLAYGLLPAIVLHYAYDVTWMSLPLFVSTASGIWIDRGLVLLLALVPLGAVILARRKTGRWNEVSPSFLNGAWRPIATGEVQEAEPGEAPTEAPADEEVEAPAPAGRARAWAALGAAGLAAWLACGDFTVDAPPISLGREEVEAKALAELQDRGIALDDSWETVSTIVNPLGTDDSFVWREGGPEQYRDLMGKYLSPPLWIVRFVTFSGDVADRAEEYQVHFNGKGERVRFVHQLPEKAAGASISESEARKLADDAVASLYGLDPQGLVLVSSEPIKRDNRLDWVFVYSDREHWKLEEGDARIEITINGDELGDGRRFVFVPEDWIRNERSRRMVGDILKYGSYGVLVLVLLGGMVWAVVSWSRRRFSVRAFLVGAVTAFVLNLLGVFNNWYQALAGFSTAQPFRNQVLLVILGGLLVSVFLSGALGLLLGLAHSLAGEGRRVPGGFRLAGVSLGLAAAGLTAAAGLLFPDLEPFWPDPGALNEVFPLLFYFVSPAMSFLTVGILFLFVTSAVTRLSLNWTSRKVFFSLVLIFFGFLLAGTRGAPGVGSWAVSGMVAGLAVLAAYATVVRFSPAAVPPALAALALLGQASTAWIHPGLLPVAGFLVASAVLASAAAWWSRTLSVKGLK